jgi:methylenetetrahydrofolate dehydrogenase (NADP+)/methenyltetrahydrofolate cyclohydrolase
MILLNGKELSEQLYNSLRHINKKDCYKLIILTVGNDEASKVYVRNKIKACERMGIVCKHLFVKEDIPVYEFADYIKDLIKKEFHCKKSYDGGIILQLPAPKHLVDTFNRVIPPSYDVDGFGDFNKRQLMTGEEPCHYPATPKGIMTILENYDIQIEGKHVVIIGRSDIVGKPLAQMMLNKNASVTICHSKTEKLDEITKTADIIVVAIGKPKFINDKHIKDNATVIDVGINRTENGICGDVDFEKVKDKCYAITPVPGGVGPMTVYSLIENTMTEFIG